MPLDLTADLAAALRTDEGRAALAEVLAPVVRRELREALQEHAADRFVDIAGAAKHCGMTPGAFKVRLGSDAELARLRLGTGRLTRFRATDLDAWLARRQSQKRGRQVEG